MTEIELTDGRWLTVMEFGPATGAPVIVHQTTPGGPVLHPDTLLSAQEHGLRLVTYARPGYSASTRQAGRAVSDAASDTAAVADSLGLERFLTWGSSGGGPHALACAALLPDRVVGAATLGSVGPYGAPGLDFLAGMGAGNIEEFGLVLDGDDAATRSFLEAELTGLLSSTVDELVTQMAPHLSELDAAEMRNWFGALFLAQIQDGCRHGAFGWVDDDLAFIHDWGFDLASIRVPVLLMQGRHDAMVPFAHGEWLAGHIPGVDARLSELDGHLSLLSRRITEVHGWLRDRWDAAAG